MASVINFVFVLEFSKELFKMNRELEYKISENYVFFAYVFYSLKN